MSQYGLFNAPTNMPEYVFQTVASRSEKAITRVKAGSYSISRPDLVDLCSNRALFDIKHNPLSDREVTQYYVGRAMKRAVASRSLIPLETLARATEYTSYVATAGVLRSGMSFVKIHTYPFFVPCTNDIEFLRKINLSHGFTYTDVKPDKVIDDLEKYYMFSGAHTSSRNYVSNRKIPVCRLILQSSGKFDIEMGEVQDSKAILPGECMYGLMSRVLGVLERNNICRVEHYTASGVRETHLCTATSSMYLLPSNERGGNALGCLSALQERVLNYNYKVAKFDPYVIAVQEVKNGKLTSNVLRIPIYCINNITVIE